MSELGWAYLTAFTQTWLDRCDAVKEWWSDRDDTIAVFEFDPMVEVHVIPPGVHFSMDDAPAEAIDLISRLLSK